MIEFVSLYASRWSGYHIFWEKYFLHDCASHYHEEGNSVLLQNVATYGTKLHDITTKATIDLKRDYSFISCNESCKPEQ
jgi:hypothetical protein